MVERWRDDKMRDGLSRRNAVKLVTVLHSIYTRAGKVYRVAENPAAEVGRLAQCYDAGRFEFYSPEKCGRSCGLRPPSRTEPCT